MAKAKNEENKDIRKLKDELCDYVDKQVKKSINDRIDNANKRLIREKNKKVLTRDIIIIILIGIITFLVYTLYTEDYFTKFFIKDSEVEKIINNNKNKEEKEVTLDDLKDEYGYLLDEININEESKYVDDFYSAKLTDELKNYITLNTIDFDKISSDDGYSIIDEKTFKEKYNKIFSDKYTSVNFDYDGNEIKYIDKLSSYISNVTLEKKDSNIKREIVDISINNDEIEITTIEGLIKDDSIYNVLSDEEIDEYKDDTNLKEYEADLNKVVYIFKDNKLINLK